jgi:hypothetical protein
MWSSVRGSARGSRARSAAPAAASPRRAAPPHPHAPATPPPSLSTPPGPGALLQSCTIHDYASIGAGAIVMEGALVEKHARLEEGAVVHPGRRIPGGQVWGGNPAVYVRDLSKTELAEAEGHAEEVAAAAGEHAGEFLPYTTAYRSAEALRLEEVDPALAAIKAKHSARMVEEGDAEPPKLA